MINLSGIKTLATNSLGRTGLILSKKSPEILLGVGIVGIAGGVFLACRATLKAEKVIQKTKETLENIEKAKQIITESKDTDITYTDEEAKRDLAITYVQTGVELGKLYLPAIAVIGVSIALIIGSHNILSKRNAAIAAAYRLLDASFKKYRERVVAEYGKDEDQKFRFGQKEVEVTETNAKGKEVKKIKKVLDTNGDLNPYSFVFAEGLASQYKRSYEMNEALLKSVERYANDILQTRGHIFLSEILDTLGIKRTPASIVTGWVLDHNPHNPGHDRYITFDWDNPINEQKADPYESMVQPFYLNFNVDGNVYDLI